MFKIDVNEKDTVGRALLIKLDSSSNEIKTNYTGNICW